MCVNTYTTSIHNHTSLHNTLLHQRTVMLPTCTYVQGGVCAHLDGVLMGTQYSHMWVVCMHARRCVCVQYLLIKVLVQSILQHCIEGCGRLRLELKPHNGAHLHVWGGGGGVREDEGGEGWEERIGESK